MATLEDLTQGLIKVNDNLYMDDQGNYFNVNTPTAAASDIPQWMWFDDPLQALGGTTTHNVTPFLNVQEDYLSGAPIQADTWQDAVRQSLEGFMRVAYVQPEGAPIDPVFMWNQESGADPSSVFRMGTLQDLVQDPSIAGLFFDTGNTGGSNMFLNEHQLGIGNAGLANEVQNGFTGAQWMQEAQAAGITPGQSVSNQQWAALSPEARRFAQAQFGFVPPSSGSGSDIDPLLGLSANDRLLVFEDVAPGVTEALEDMFGPVADFIKQQGSDQDYNDYIFKLNIGEYAPPPELVEADTTQALQNFFDTTGYQLLYGDDVDASQGPVERFRADPGYQFAQDEGMRQVQRNAAAKGLLESGATMRDLQYFGQGLADQNYQRYLGNQNQLYNQYMNNLRGTANTGASMSSGQAQQQMANLLAGLGGQSAGDLASLLNNQGTTGLSSYLNTGSALANLLMQGGMAQAQLDMSANAANSAQQSSMFGGIGQLAGGLLGGFF